MERPSQTKARLLTLKKATGRRLTAWLCARGLHVRRGPMVFKEQDVVTSVATRCLGCNLFLGMRYLALALVLMAGTGCASLPLPAVGTGATLTKDTEWVDGGEEGFRKVDRYTPSLELDADWSRMSLSGSWSPANQDYSVGVRVPLYTPRKGE